MRIAPEDRTRLLKEAIRNGLVLLPYDIETSHALIKTFRIGNDCHISHTQIVEPSQVISIQFKLPKMRKTRYLEWTTLPGGRHDDSTMIESFITGPFAEAHIVLTQNGDAYDHKVLNDRAMVQKLSVIQQKPSIDVLKLSRKSFKAASHKLDFRSARLGFGGKMRMMEQDWFDVEDNKVPVSKKMGPYGCKDVDDTLKVFWEELPYYKDLPVTVEKEILRFLSAKTLASLVPTKKTKVIKIKPEPKIKRICPYCRAKHRLATSIKEFKLASGDVVFKCQNCKGYLT